VLNDSNQAQHRKTNNIILLICGSLKNLISDKLKKNTGDEPIQVIIHIYTEMSQGDSVLLSLKKAYFFLLENQRTGGLNRSSSGGLELVGGCGRVNILQILCAM
jgi:hypothetical protein